MRRATDAKAARASHLMPRDLSDTCTKVTQEAGGSGSGSCGSPGVVFASLKCGHGMHGCPNKCV